MCVYKQTKQIERRETVKYRKDFCNEYTQQNRGGRREDMFVYCGVSDLYIEDGVRTAFPVHVRVEEYWNVRI